MLSVRGFPLGARSCEGQRVQKKFVQESFIAANKVLKGVRGKKTRYLQNGAGGVIVKLGLYFTLNLTEHRFV